MRVAVVGHVEWVEFARVERVPAAGEIVQARESWEEAAGGGSVAAVQLAKLAGEATFFTVVGEDELGLRAAERLRELGLRVEAARRGPQRRAFTYVDDGGERTITVIGEKLAPHLDDALPWDELRRHDAVFFVAGDAGAVRAARGARLLTATTRSLSTLREAGAQLDAVVGSGRDPSERYARGDIEPPPGIVVRTDGPGGGSYEVEGGASGRYDAVPPPRPIADVYGCGDSFAGGLTFGLAAGHGVERALELAARCGAACATGRGPYEAQIRS